MAPPQESLARRLATLLARVGGARVALQVVAIAAGAALTGLAGWMYSDAASSWQQAVRDEVNRYGVYQDDVRTVYANEGQFAFRIAAMEIRAQALEKAKDAGPTARIQYEVAVQTAFALRRQADPDGVGGDRVYDRPDGGADLPRRLAAVSDAHPSKPDPDASSREGDRQARTALNISLFTVLVTGLTVAGAYLRSPARRGKAGRGKAGRAGSAVELVPQPGAASGRHRRTAQLLLAVWVAGVLVPLLQLTLSSGEQHAQAGSARTAIEARTAKSIRLTRTEFRLAARQQAAETDMTATAREIGTVYAAPEEGAEGRAVARAEEVAAARCTEVADAMARAPGPQDGLDPSLLAALTSGAENWTALTERTLRETARGDAFGLASNLTIVLISLIVVAEARLELRHARR